MRKREPHRLPDDHSEGNRSNQDHKQRSIAERLDHNPLKQNPEEAGPDHGQDDQEGNEDERWKKGQKSEKFCQAIENKDQKGTQDTNISMGKMNHIQGTKKEIEPNGN